VVFTGNLADRLRGRVVPELVTTSEPDPGFWRDIDVRTPFPRRGLVDSVCAHAALLGVLYAVSIWPEPRAHLDSPLSRRARDGYTISQYLPELHGSPSHSRAGGKHDPTLAKQEILSLPKAPDNLHQTIVSPPAIKLQKDVNLPNIVAYSPAAPVQPLADGARDLARLRLPTLLPRVIGPAADTSFPGSRSHLPAFQRRIAEALPDVTQDVTQAHPRLVLPAFQSKVVEPAPDPGYTGRGASDNFAQLAPRIVPPIPEMQQIADAGRSLAQVIALSLHPAEVHGPVELPSGNRSGAFAASPGGHAKASGTPGANGAALTGGGSKLPANAPAGISVGAPAGPAKAVAAPNAPAPNSASADPNIRARFMAVMRPPLITPIPPHQAIVQESTGARSALENRIFGGRRSYTLSVNMPNLNAATGSWIIHFVERDAGIGHSPIAAPEVLSKFDPAYPGDLMHDGVQGVVILTAIIRSDGSVGDIAVVRSLDPRLDHNAVEAFSHWLFRPGLKDGLAIDLEAVITVPFRLKEMGLR
jgi:protein TonB